MLKFGERAANAIRSTGGFHLRQRASLKILRFTFHHVVENKIVRKKLCHFKHLGGKQLHLSHCNDLTLFQRLPRIMCQ